jgi:hypothetical protein
MKKLICTTALLLCSAAFSQVPSLPSPIPGIPTLPPLGQGNQIDKLDKLKAVKRLPVTGLSIVETIDGQVYLVSDNGRVGIIGGRWMDMWEGREFTNIADATTLDKINFGRMGISLDDFSPYVIGTGSKIVTAFIDPLCDECRALVKQMPSLGKEYMFNVILLPLRGQASGIAARRMHCSPDKKLALTAFLNNSMTTLPESPKDCDVAALQKVMIAATILGIRVSPFFILPDFTTVAAPGRDRKLTDLIARK